MSEYLDAIFDSREKIRQISYELSGISKCFYNTGNSYMGELLADLSTELMQTQKEIKDTVSLDINRRLKHSQESCAATLKACLTNFTETTE